MLCGVYDSCVLEMTMSSAIRIWLRGLSVGYLVLLTILLLVPDPMGVLRPERGLYGLVAWLMPSAHFLAMGALSLLMMAARWPLPSWSLILLLVAYAAGTEGLQGLVPARTSSLADIAQNLAGIAAGLAVWLVAAMVVERRRSTGSRGPAANDVPKPR